MNTIKYDDVKRLQRGDMLSDGENYLIIEHFLGDDVVVFWNGSTAPSYYPMQIFIAIVMNVYTKLEQTP